MRASLQPTVVGVLAGALLTLVVIFTLRRVGLTAAGSPYGGEGQVADSGAL